MSKDVYDLNDPDDYAAFMSMMTGRTVLSKDRAQSSRPELAEPTLEEEMAAQLRLISSIPSFVREHKFHPARNWRFDFAWPKHPRTLELGAGRLALEIEGGTRQGGRHNRHKGFEGDCEKYNEALLLGWLVMRVTSDMVKDGRALRFVERFFKP